MQVKSSIDLGEIHADVVMKSIKHVHLSVYPPDGRVHISAPLHMTPDTLRVYAITKLDWIRQQRKKLCAQARETPREYLSRESHQVWGQRYLLDIRYADEKPTVKLTHRQLVLTARPGSDAQKCAEILHDWYKTELHRVVPELIREWETRLGVKVRAYFLQRMKTKWGSANPAAGHIRLNTELAKKPKVLLEYVIVHEMAHLRVPSHNEAFVALMDASYPAWREARTALNALPLAAEAWSQKC